MIERRSDVITDRRSFPRLSVESGEIKARRRRGRPPRVPGEVADQRAWTFLTKTEKAAAKKVADDNGVDLAELIRDAVNDYVESIGERRIIATRNSQSASHS